MKRLWIMLLALSLLFTGLCCANALGEAAQSEELVLPAVGDKIGGFVVKSVSSVEILGATAITFEHEKNGAKLVYLASDDQNVSFDITFKTPALDEKGKPHVFEHMTICGSQKYADPNLFFPFTNQTYNTFINALTFHGMTTYPLSSLSETQLMTMMDYYLSGVFEPLVASEPRMASREAWRYEMSSADSPLTITGTVYSEMQGSLTTATLAASNNTMTMFQDGLTAHVSGGRPEAIRTLTWEELITFHDTYYHPSNALIILYGKLDYEKFIQYIDTEYISKFDRQDVYVEYGKIEPYTETAYATYEVPVESNAETENASYIHYSFASNEMTLKDSIELNYFTNVLSSNNSPVMRLLNERLPGVSCSVFLDVDSPSPLLIFEAANANESDRDTFVQAIDEGLAQIKREGISQDDFDAIQSLQKLALMMTCENATLGVNASQQIALYWTYFDSLDYYQVTNEVYSELTADDMERLLDVYLLNNPYRGVSVTKPVAGLAEENAQALQNELAQKKESMTAEEIQAMVDNTASFNEWSSAPANSEILNQLVNMTVDQLPETLPEFDYVDETINDVRYLTTAVEMGDVANTVINFDVSSIPKEQLVDAYVYTNLLGKLDTKSYTKEEISTQVYLKLGLLLASIGASPSYIDQEQDQYCISLSMVGLGENAKDGLELVGEILFSSDFTQITDVKNALTEELSILPSVLDSEPLSAQIARCDAVLHNTGAFNAYVTTVGLYDQLQEMIALADTDPQALTARLENARTLVLNAYHATVLCVGNQKAVDAYVTQAKNLLSQMPSEPREKVDYSALRLSFTNEAVVNNATVHMNVLLSNSDGYSGKLVPIAALINDQYLLPKLRNAMGAYGAGILFDRFADTLYTYRDPNLTETFAVFDALPEYLRTAEITQEQVDRYIIGSYGNLMTAQGKLTKAFDALLYQWYGVSNEERMEWLHEAKSTTVEDVRATVERVENMLANGVRSTSGTASSIEEHKELFDNVLKLKAQ
ncbi:MAG: insulinase family protein [Eubacteriales bacterium]|nr:insulinase family protein [Eubacteriales bacterium]